MSVETRSLSRALLLAFAAQPGSLGDLESRFGASVDPIVYAWDLAERWDREGRKREANEAKTFVPPAPQRASDK